MTKLQLAAAAGVTACIGLFATATIAAQQDAEKSAIKDAMKGGFKGDTSYAKLASTGKATKEEIAKLKAYCESLCKEKPPVGDDASWKEKTDALTKAVADLEAGAADAAKNFEKAANCKACHEVHKPKKK